VDLGLSADQRALVASVSSLLGTNSTTARVRQAEERGFDPDLWRRLTEFGAVAMGVPEAAGGGGATLVDLALVAEQAGRYLASAPLVEAVVAARLLARCGTARYALLDHALASTEPLVIALHRAVQSTFRLVPGGAVAGLVVGLDGADLIAVTDQAPGRARANIGSAALADRSAAPAAGSRTVLLAGPTAAVAYEGALAEWKALTAAALVGLAQGALDLAVEYAKTRHQFGVPIGSFQALSHRLADCATALEGARLLTREAAWSFGAEPDGSGEFGSPALASMAFVFAAETAQQITAASLHVHGGMGFAMETDVQLFFRRAQAWPQVYSGIRAEYQRLADLEFGPAGVR
jgi:alkylation response protein AidB-like acyl-CoA dehydrogenase